MRGKKATRGARGGRGKGKNITFRPPQPPVEDSDSSQEAPSRSENDSPQPNPSSKRRRLDTVEMLLATVAEKRCIEEELCTRLLNPDKRRAFSDFITSSIMDIDETLWDTYTHEALKLLVDFKRRSRAAPPVPGAPVVNEDDKDEQ